MKEQITVITLVNGRERALNNLIKGLKLGVDMPEELVIVFMNEAPYSLADVPFPIKTVTLNCAEKIPLAEARNLGVENASFNHLLFLDVDCIPNKWLVKDYRNLTGNDLYCGTVKYLSRKTMCRLNFNELDEMSTPDPIRFGIEELPYELFWSLNFACNRKVFYKIGGFSEEFKGYGAEDTDFSFKARECQIPLKHPKIVAYHQFHKSYQPPLNHFDDIISNASIFYQKWGKWPMEGWLTQFENLGLIAWGKEISVIRRPSFPEIEQALKRD